MFQLHRKRFSIRRNASKRWQAARSAKDLNVKDRDWNPPIVIKATNMCEEMQRQSLEVVHAALAAHNVENMVATYIKTQFDELHSKTWHCIVGRNFGSHVSFELYIHFLLDKISIILFKCG